MKCVFKSAEGMYPLRGLWQVVKERHAAWLLAETQAGAMRPEQEEGGGRMSQGQGEAGKSHRGVPTRPLGSHRENRSPIAGALLSLRRPQSVRTQEQEERASSFSTHNVPGMY